MGRADKSRGQAAVIHGRDRAVGIAVRAPGGKGRLCETEVDQLHKQIVPAQLVLHEHDVRGLDVAMDHFLRPRGLQRLRHLQNNLERDQRRKLLLALDQGLKRLAFDILHRIKIRVPLLALIEYGRDVRMLDAGCRARLAQESSTRRVVVQQPVADDLEHDRAPQARVERLVGNAHATAPQLDRSARGILLDLKLLKMDRISHGRREALG